MKPPAFIYHRPTTRDEVDGLLHELADDAKILAGGQSLVPILNMRLAAPAHLVDINGLVGESEQPALRSDKVIFGPLVRHAALERDELVAERAPLLRELVQYVAHPPIRNRGTVVGSIAHADPAAELPAAFALLGGEAHARSRQGARLIPADELFASQLETSLRPGEWIDEISVPVAGEGHGYAVEEFARRHGDYAVCGVVAHAWRTQGGGVSIALAYMSMATRPERIELPPLEPAAVDGPPLEELVAAAVRDRLDPAADLHATVEFRTALGNRLGTRAARRAARMAVEGVA